MIDIIFLLLLFFLVAAKWRPEEDFLPFRLAVAQGEGLQVGKAEPLIIEIVGAEGGCKVQIGRFDVVRIEDGEIEAGLSRLLGALRDCMIREKRVASDPVEIVCGAEVKWDYLAKIYNMFFGAGLTDITFRMTE